MTILVLTGRATHIAGRYAMLAFDARDVETDPLQAHYYSSAPAQVAGAGYRAVSIHIPEAGSGVRFASSSGRVPATVYLGLERSND